MWKKWDKILQIKICLTITRIDKSDENKIYLLFAGFKKNFVTNELKHPFEILDK